MSSIGTTTIRLEARNHLSEPPPGQIQGRFGPRAGASPTLSRVSGIGVMREGPLHAAIKSALAGPGDRFEVPVGRFVIDLVRADGELVEVQTGGFGALGCKLDTLLDQHRVRIVHPIAVQRRIVRVDGLGEVVSARRSPRRATALAVFDQLVAFPSLITHPHLTLELWLLAEDHVRAEQPVTVGRRTRDPGERRLVEVLDRIEVRGSEDLVGLLGGLPPGPFSTTELTARLGCTRRLGGRVVYCLRALEIVESAGQRGRAPLFRAAAR